MFYIIATKVIGIINDPKYLYIYRDSGILTSIIIQNKTCITCKHCKYIFNSKIFNCQCLLNNKIYKLNKLKKEHGVKKFKCSSWERNKNVKFINNIYHFKPISHINLDNIGQKYIKIFHNNNSLIQRSPINVTLNKKYKMTIGVHNNYMYINVIDTIKNKNNLFSIDILNNKYEIYTYESIRLWELYVHKYIQTNINKIYAQLLFNNL